MAAKTKKKSGKRIKKLVKRTKKGMERAPKGSSKSKTSKKEVDARVPVDIPGLDKLIGGGFKKKTINMVTGDTGSGKTIFAIQFLLNGIEKFNETGLYITFEEKKDKLYSDMKSLGWDLEKYEKSGKLVFLEYSPEQVKKVLIEGGGIIESIITKSNVKRLVIDSITSFALLYTDDLTRKEAALSLFELINSWDCTALLTSQEVISRDKAITSLEFEVDSIIVLYHEMIKGRRIRAMEILKMRGVKHPEIVMGLEITGSGLKIVPNKKVVL